MTAHPAGRDEPTAAAANRGGRWRRGLGSVGVQGLGALATLAAGLLIAAWQGPQAQGRYGLVRSTADLLLALGLCGLPQGIVHVLNHLRLAPSQVERWMLRYLAGLLLLSAGLLGWRGAVGELSPAVAAAGLGIGTGGGTSTGGDNNGALPALLALAVGVFGWLVHGLQRVFVLCRGSTPRFSWLSVAPSLTLLAAVALLARYGSHRYEWAVAFSGVASACCGAWAMRALRHAPAWRLPPTVAAPSPAPADPPVLAPAPAVSAAPAASAVSAGSAVSTNAVPPAKSAQSATRATPTAGPTRWTALLRPSLHALVQTAALALQPWLALQLLLRQVPAGGSEVGWFVFASHVAQAFALPASFVAPLVFARASRAAGLGDRLGGGLVRPVGWVTLAAALAAAAVLPVAVPALFGPAYAGATGACVALALAGPALVVGRLHTALLLGEGRFAAVTLLFVMRAALLPLCMLALWRWTALDTVTAAAAGWALAETLASGAQAALRRRRRDRQSASA